MAIWQFRLILIPERELLLEHDILPSEIPMTMAEDFAWWSNAQPFAGFERQIDLILPRMESWSTSMRMWGIKHSDDAWVCYEDESKNRVEEIQFRIDAACHSPVLVRHICQFAKELGCVLMTSDYAILLPDESMVLATISKSTARGFVEDPVSTLQNLDQSKMQPRIEHTTNDLGDAPHCK